MMTKPPLEPARIPLYQFDGPVAAHIDLHGQSALQARASIESFLKTSRARYRDGLVHMTTGKGRNSGAKGPVLLAFHRGTW
jgi:DNA-nicking Smr family endonuclease